MDRPVDADEEDVLPPGASRRLTPEQRRQRARLAAYSRWSQPNAREEQSRAASDALWRRYEAQVDPDGVLPDDRRRELAKKAAKAQSARMNMVRQRRPDPGE